MRRLMVFIFISVTLLAHTDLQPLWQKRFDTAQIADIEGALMHPDGSFIAVGKSCDANRLTVFSCDRKGTILRKKVLPFDYAYDPKIVALQQGGYVVAAPFHEKSGRNRIVLIKLNKKVKVEWIKKTDLDDFDHAVAAIAPLRDGGFVLIDFAVKFLSDERSVTSNRLLRFDADGKMVEKTPLAWTLLRIKELSNGDLAAAGAIKQRAGTPLKLLLVRLDHRGKLKRLHLYPQIPYNGDDPLLLKSDGSVALVYQTDRTSDRYRFALIDKRGDSVHISPFEAKKTIFHALLPWQNGGYLLIGERILNRPGLAIVLQRFDAKAKMKKERSFGRYYGDPIKFATTDPKGELLIGGSVVKGTRFYGLIVKLKP